MIARKARIAEHPVPHRQPVLLEASLAAVLQRTVGEYRHAGRGQRQHHIQRTRRLAHVDRRARAVLRLGVDAHAVQPFAVPHEFAVDGARHLHRGIPGRVQRACRVLRHVQDGRAFRFQRQQRIFQFAPYPPAQLRQPTLLRGHRRKSRLQQVEAIVQSALARGDRHADIPARDARHAWRLVARGLDSRQPFKISPNRVARARVAMRHGHLHLQAQGLARDCHRVSPLRR
ncbi:hypothetical protein D3C87_1345370 [compost metagenome]